MKTDFLRRVLCLVLCLVLALSLAAFPALADDETEGGEGEGGAEQKPEITGVKLVPETLELNPGELSDAIEVVPVPEGAGLDGAVTWRSSDENVATVKDGVVSAKSTGRTTVTASVGGFEAKCEVEVLNTLAVRSIEFTDSEIIQSYTSSEKRSVGVSVTPPGASYKGISFSSDDESIVKIAADESDPTGRNAVLDFKDSKPGETFIRAGVDNTNVAGAQCRVTVSGIVLKHDGKELDSSSRLTLTMGVGQTVAVDTYGDAKNIAKVDWYSENNAVLTVTNGRLTPRSVGSTKITAMRGNYTASFNVTVNENKSGLVEIGESIPAGAPMSFREIRPDIYSQFSKDTEELYGSAKALYYVTSLSVPPSQGVLYHGYISEADTGAGVSMTDRFYYSSSSPSDYMLGGVTFVPNSTFSGRAEISYTAVARDNSTVSGVIRLSVDAMEDVSYTTGSGQNVFFKGSDFGTICRLRTGRELSGVTFTLPSSSRGTLYYNYTADNQYTGKVDAATRYRRTGSPNLDSVSFLPADGFSGSVRISYRGTDTAGGTFSGYVTVTVTGRGSGGADVRFSAKTGREVSFTTWQFSDACREATGESLEYVQFTLPDSSDGTLYYTSGSTERRVTEKTAYYRSSSPYISDVSFVPAKNAPDQVRIAYSGRSTGGTAYSGTILIDYSGTANSEAISYSVYSGRAVQFDAPDFNTACIEATGSTLNYVYFEPPSASRGLLCYNYTAASNPRSINSTTRYYRSASGNSISRVWFLADPAYTGTADISYTGYSNDGESFTGTVSIRVNSLAPAEVRFSGSASQPISLSASQIRYACNAVMDGELSHIEFTSLPSSSQGRIYRGYTGYDSGTQVVTGTPYYVSASPGIDQLSFVPRGGFSGTAYAGYTGVSDSGERVSGQISFAVASADTSSYFSDMSGYSWAVPAADYLHQNGVINGVGSGRYAPGDNIRRCDFVVMLCRAYDLSGGTGMTFADVAANSYYASAVSTASSLGIVNGDGRNFRPNDQLTRQDAIVIVKRTLEAVGWSLGGGSNAELYYFGDGDSVAAYARDAVAALVRLGAINGDGNGNLRPWDPINRAEAAVILHYVMTM